MGKIFVLVVLNAMSIYVLPSAGVTGYLIIRYIVDANLSLGSFSAGIDAANKLSWILRDIGNYLNRFNEHSLYIEKVKKFLAYAPKIQGDEAEVPAFETLTVKNLDFAYPFSEKTILRHVNLEIRKGEKIAFVGYNGAGKTTLIKLLMHLYDATSGEILYNGRNIKDFSPGAILQHIGAVFSGLSNLCRHHCRKRDWRRIPRGKRGSGNVGPPCGFLHGKVGAAAKGNSVSADDRVQCGWGWAFWRRVAENCDCTRICKSI